MTEVPHYRMYINGAWRDAPESIDARSPATGQLIATVAQGDGQAAAHHPRVCDPHPRTAGPMCSMRSPLTYRDDDEAVAIANDSEYGLSAGVWSTDPNRVLSIAHRLESGTVWINDWHMINAMYPFGGVKQRGLGRELGPDALDEYTEPKFVHLDLTNDRSKRLYGVVVSAAAP